MNKDDLFTFNVYQISRKEFTVSTALTWEPRTVCHITVSRESLIPDAKQSGMGYLMDKFCDKIIEHIQSDIITRCPRCGIVLLHGNTSHLCDPDKPMPFNFNNIRQKAIR